MNQISRISSKGNTTVFKSSERNYAGIGIQADTLKSLTDELSEAIQRKFMRKIIQKQ